MAFESEIRNGLDNEFYEMEEWDFESSAAALTLVLPCRARLTGIECV